MCTTRYDSALVLGREFLARTIAGSVGVDARRNFRANDGARPRGAQQIESKLGQRITKRLNPELQRVAGGGLAFTAAFTPDGGPQDMSLHVVLTPVRRSLTDSYARTVRNTPGQEFV